MQGLLLKNFHHQLEKIYCSAWKLKMVTIAQHKRLRRGGGVIHTHPKYGVKVEPWETESDKFGEEEEAGGHGTPLEQGGEDQLERVGQDGLLHRRNGLWVHVHDGAQQGEHQLGYMEVTVADQDRQLLQDGLVEGCGDSGHALGAGARADEGVLAVALEDGVQAVQSGQAEVAVVLAEEAGKQGDGLVLETHTTEMR